MFPISSRTNPAAMCVCLLCMGERHATRGEYVCLYRDDEAAAAAACPESEHDVKDKKNAARSKT